MENSYCNGIYIFNLKNTVIFMSRCQIVDLINLLMYICCIRGDDIWKILMNHMMQTSYTKHEQNIRLKRISPGV